MTLTYGDSVALLSTFMRKQGAQPSAHFGTGATGQLFDALHAESGDFAVSLRSAFSEVHQPITKSIWYVAAGDKGTPPTAPPVFTFDNAMSAIGMLVFVIPEVGPVAATGANVLQAVVDNAERRLAWMRETSQVTNPPDNPYQVVVDQLKTKLDDDDVRKDIASVFAAVNTIQSMLNRVLVDPSEVKDAATGRIRVGQSLTKSYVLGPDGLGAVFELVNSDPWRRIVGADSEWVNRSLDASLYQNPSYAQATSSAFMHAALTVVNGVLAYAFLYPLPDQAFRPGWNGTNPDGSPYDALSSITATRDTSPQPPLSRTAWDALELLRDQLDPNAGDDTSNWINRLGDSRGCWSAIASRLSSVELHTCQPAYRNKMWYLEASESKTKEVSGGDPVILNLWDVVTKDVCRNGQVVCLDRTLNKPARDAMVAPYRNFRTHLTQSWAMSKDAASIVQYVLSPIGPVGMVTAQTATEVVLWNESFSSFSYPLVPGGSHDGATGYDDLFWTPASNHDAALDNPATPGFLATAQGRDVCAWLGYVLATYCAGYHFEVDLTHDTTTLEVATTVRDLFGGVHDFVSRILGEAQ